MRLCLCIKDKDYLTSFIDMASKIDKDIYLNLNFSGTINEEELLVTDYKREGFENIFPNANLKSVCFISNKIDENVSDYPFIVFKYQFFRDLISKIYICYTISTGYSNKHTVMCKKIGVCFDTEIYKSDYANSLAKQIVYKYGYKTLIFPLQDIFDYDHCVNSSLGTSHFKKLLYFVKRGGDAPFNAFFREDSYGVSHFNLLGPVNPINRLDGSSLLELIKSLTMNFFEVVVFDVSRSFTAKNQEILKEMDEVIIVSNNQKSELANLIENNIYIADMSNTDSNIDIKISEHITKMFEEKDE